MKAKVKATGEVIDVEIDKCAVPVIGNGASYVYLGSNGKAYLDIQLDFINVYPDWQHVKVQAAIAAMQGFYSNTDILRIAKSDTKDKPSTVIAKIAVEQANALIEELKKTM